MVITALLYPPVRLHSAGAGHSLPCQKHRQGHPHTGLGTAESVWALQGTCAGYNMYSLLSKSAKHQAQAGNRTPSTEWMLQQGEADKILHV